MTNVLLVAPFPKRGSATAIVSIGLLLLVSANQSFPGNKTHAPLHAKVLSAKSICIENHASAKDADRVYEELKKWGRWEILQDRAKADLVLVLSAQKGQSSTGQTQTYDPNMKTGDMTTGGWKYGTATSHTPGAVHLELMDSKTGESLYADTARAAHGIFKELQKRIEEQEKENKTK